MRPASSSGQDLADARLLQQDLADVIRSPQRISDAESLEEVRRMCQMLRITVQDTRCHDCLGQIERYAEFFFIADDSKVRWTWHTPQKYAALRRLLLRLANALGTRLTYLEIRKRSDELKQHTQQAEERLGLLSRRNLIRRPGSIEVPAGPSDQLRSTTSDGKYSRR